MTRRRQLVVWGLALGLVLAAVGLEGLGPREEAPRSGTHDHSHGSVEDVPGRFPVFTFGEPDLGAVVLLHRGQRIDFARDGDGMWRRARSEHGDPDHGDPDPDHGDHDHGGADHDHGDHDHGGADHDHGDDGVGGGEGAEGIASQFAFTARMLADRSITPTQPLGAYGLGTPETVVFFFSRGRGGIDRSRLLDVLNVGDLLTTGYAYYATSRSHPGEVLLLPRYHVALLLTLAVGEENAPAPLPPPGEV